MATEKKLKKGSESMIQAYLTKAFNCSKPFISGIGWWTIIRCKVRHCTVIRMFNMLMTETMLQNPRSVGDHHEFHLRFFVHNN
jgi:hypothetical protein